MVFMIMITFEWKIENSNFIAFSENDSHKQRNPSLEGWLQSRYDT